MAKVELCEGGLDLISAAMNKYAATQIEAQPKALQYWFKKLNPVEGANDFAVVNMSATEQKLFWLFYEKNKNLFERDLHVTRFRSAAGSLCVDLRSLKAPKMGYKISYVSCVEAVESAMREAGAWTNELEEEAAKW